MERKGANLHATDALQEGLMPGVLPRGERKLVQTVVRAIEKSARATRRVQHARLRVLDTDAAEQLDEGPRGEDLAIASPLFWREQRLEDGREEAARPKLLT